GNDLEQFQPFNDGRRFVVVGHDEQLWQLRRLPQELETFAKGLAGKLDQRLHLGGMAACRFDGIFNADYACASDAYYIALYSRLRDQVLKRCVKVERPLLLSCLTVAFLPTGFAVPANIEGQRVDSRSRELPGQVGPLLSCPVALVK